MLRSGAATRVFAALLPLTMAAAFTGVAPALSLRGRGVWRSGTRPLCPLRMALEPAAAMPMDLSLAVTGDGGPEKVSTKEVFGGKRCVIFGVSGAFEPKSTKQLESYMGKLLDLKAGGAELVACVSVNDPYVMKAWAKSEGVGTGNSTIQMLADGDGTFTRALGYMADGDGLLGDRSKPFAIVLDEKGVCEFMVQDSEDMDLKVMGHLDFLKGTGAVSKAISSKVAGLASKVRSVNMCCHIFRISDLLPVARGVGFVVSRTFPCLSRQRAIDRVRSACAFGRESAQALESTHARKRTRA